MGFTTLFTESTLAKYGRSIGQAPREIIFNKHLLLSTALYATSSIPLTWDQGSSSVIPNLPGFQNHFGFSNEHADSLRYYVSIVYLGAGIGGLLSYFINDRVGRLWSWRIYVTVWSVGQVVAALTPTLQGLYVSRVISGLGIGSLTVTGTMSIVEIAPTEFRGLLAVWFSVAMTLASVCAVFCVYGVYAHIPTSRLQYQVVMFSPIVFFAILMAGSFFLCESPRWQWNTGRQEEAVATLVRLRGLPANHPRVQTELQAIQESVQKELDSGGGNSSRTVNSITEMFTVRANLRRLQQSLCAYALAQLSGANSITSYVVPILRLLGTVNSTTESLFLGGMYSFSKLCFTLIASFFFIDALGRRRSLFTGASLQMISDIYLGVYLKYQQAGKATSASSKAALAALFIHAFGYAVGLFVLPYVFGGELFPNRLRSLGGALSQCFHWLFFFAMNFAVPSLLSSTHNWGAFLFFAAWCFIAILYVYFMVPELAGLSVEEIDDVFEGPWFNAYRKVGRRLPDAERQRDDISDGSDEKPTHQRYEHQILE
ncbi:general substrate transporter [Trichoderma velutinum]